MKSLRVETDLARYDPGRPVHIHISGPAVPGGRVRLRIYHVGMPVEPDWTSSWTGTAERVWQPPQQGGYGYLAVAEVFSDRSAPVATASCGIDVSPRWTDFPRYGYLAHFGPDLATGAGEVLEWLKRFHIDGLQFYDWQWKHHHPQPHGDTWVDIAKRATSANTVRAFIREAHRLNIACMAYNLGFGGVDGFDKDGISRDWLLYRDAGHQEPYALSMPAGWATEKLYLFDPANAGWRAAIYSREKEALQSFGFDGWHMDQLGDLGTVYSANGQRVVLKDGFPALLAGAKEHVPGDLIFNNVGGYGLGESVRSPADAVYLEAWHWMGQKTYADLHRTIGEMRATGKSAILAAYMNYERAKELDGKAPGRFNVPGVLLADATIFASGGFHLELGDRSRMLCNEYFPNHNLEPDADLLDTLQAYYDFVVGYEDLLAAPDVHEVRSPIALEDRNQTPIWTFARRWGDKTIVHFINLSDPDRDEWRDPLGAHPRPKVLKNFRVKLDGVFRRAFVATPDDGCGAPRSIPITNSGIVIPRLDYWTMVVLE